MLIAEPRSHGGQSEAWGLILLFLLVWFCLAVALCVSAANGGLDWLSIGRGLQYALVLATSLAMLVVTTMSDLLRQETADQIPTGRPWPDFVSSGQRTGDKIAGATKALPS